MGAGELVAFVAVVLVTVYAWWRRPPGRWRWGPFGYADYRPLSVWEVAYVFLGAVALIWALRITHVLFFGSD